MSSGLVRRLFPIPAVVPTLFVCCLEIRGRFPAGMPITNGMVSRHSQHSTGPTYKYIPNRICTYIHSMATTMPSELGVHILGKCGHLSSGIYPFGIFQYFLLSFLHSVSLILLVHCMCVCATIRQISSTRIDMGCCCLWKRESDSEKGLSNQRNTLTLIVCDNATRVSLLHARHYSCYK